MSSVGRTTRTVRSGIADDTSHGAVIPPIHLSTNFVFDKPGECGRYDYTRSGNPTRDQLADAVAGLESGCGAVITSSGMSAVAVVTQLLSPSLSYGLCGDVGVPGGTRTHDLLLRRQPLYPTELQGRAWTGLDPV